MADVVRRVREPLAWLVALLPGRVQDPLLLRRRGDLIGDSVEPRGGPDMIADPAPPLSYKVGEGRPVITRYFVVERQRFLERPRRVSPVEPFGFDITFIRGAPRGAQPQISALTWACNLPLGELGGELVLLRPRKLAHGGEWGELLARDMLCDGEGQGRIFGALILSTGVGAARAGVYEIRQRLNSAA